jgi:hypothetical protein
MWISSLQLASGVKGPEVPEIGAAVAVEIAAVVAWPDDWEQVCIPAGPPGRPGEMPIRDLSGQGRLRPPLRVCALVVSLNVT